MSRQDFLTGVEKLLGRFDSDSFMRGFTTGFDRAMDAVVNWTATAGLTFEPGKIAEQIRKQVKTIRRRRK
jgi:hypothetical protein